MSEAWPPQAVAAIGPEVLDWQREFLEAEGSREIDGTHIITLFLSTRGWLEATIIDRKLVDDGNYLEATITRGTSSSATAHDQPATQLFYRTSDSAAIARYRELLGSRGQAWEGWEHGTIDALGQAHLVLVPSGTSERGFATYNRSGPIVVDVATYDVLAIADMMDDAQASEEQARWHRSARLALDGDWRAESVWCEQVSVLDVSVLCLPTTLRGTP